MTPPAAARPTGRADRLLRRGRLLEWATLAWNVVGVVVLATLVAESGSVALAGFGADSLIEIGASAVVLWELADTGARRRRAALRLIGVAFALLTVYLGVQSTVALVAGHHATPTVGGVLWTALTAVVMFGLAAGKRSVGAALRNPVLQTEARVTVVDGFLAVAVLVGLVLDAAAGWWWADPLAGYVLAGYAAHEALHLLRPSTAPSTAPSD